MLPPIIEVSISPPAIVKETGSGKRQLFTLGDTLNDQGTILGPLGIGVRVDLSKTHSHLVDKEKCFLNICESHTIQVRRIVGNDFNTIVSITKPHYDSFKETIRTYGDTFFFQEAIFYDRPCFQLEPDWLAFKYSIEFTTILCYQEGNERKPIFSFKWGFLGTCIKSDDSWWLNESAFSDCLSICNSIMKGAEVDTRILQVEMLNHLNTEVERQLRINDLAS